ncbi:formimidoylglutamase [Pedobacter sp.]|uniref:formimidoylglutamase n=1 Tax=Pedobacter sp. TaxID=1411316 RepID=UPI003D7F24D7
MDGFKLFTQTQLSALTITREGEVKLGQKIQTLSSLEELSRSKALFVLLGIPEDYGVLANHGIAGTANTWNVVLKSLLNVQSNMFLTGAELLLLGQFEISAPKGNHITDLYQKVEEIDELVYPLIQQIFAAGKVPIVIGGGQNNAYPIIKALSMARGRPIDVINIDAHADLRGDAGRHSGNAFSYALRDGYLKNYGIFGLHENYNNMSVLQQIETSPQISCLYFDELIKTKDRTNIWPDFNKPFDYNMGMEIDLDAIENVLSSASTPSGFTLNDMRRLVLNTKKKLSYLHLSEGAVELSDGRTDHHAAKTIVYLVTDFIKAQLNT